MDSVAPRRAAFIGQFESISNHLDKLLKQNYLSTGKERGC